MSFISHLECSRCKAIHDHTQICSVCTACGRPLLARYDMRAAAATLRLGSFAKRGPTMWRYGELLPVVDDRNIVSLGEGWTPLLAVPKFGRRLGIEDLHIKEEGLNPTGSFKARGLCAAVSKAKELGIREVAIPTAGNAGAAVAAYAASAGMTAHIYMPVDSPAINIDECRAYGADVYLVEGTIADAAKRMNAGREPGWFDMSTLKEPYRLEGKKTLGYEIAEQYHPRLPDVIVYPTGGGTGLIGMWKAFAEMEELGWLSGKKPVMVAVQSSGCAPIVRAFEQRAKVSEFWNSASTIASGLRVPKAFADDLILDALYESNGCALEVSDDAIISTIRLIATTDGLLLSPEGAATCAVLPQLMERGIVTPATRVLCYNTGSALKYAEVLRLVAEPHHGL